MSDDGSIEIGVKVKTNEAEKGFEEVAEIAKDALGGIDDAAGKTNKSTGKILLGKAAAAFKALGAAGKVAFTIILSVLKIVGVVLLSIIGIIAILSFILITIAVNLVFLAISVIKFGMSMVNSMAAAISKTDAYGKQVHELKNAFDNVKQAIFVAFAPLVQLVLPWVKMITDWLIKMINMIAMVIAWALGQSTVMQYVAGSVNDAAGGAGSYADELERANEAAEGALASFDQLNVLQQEEEPPAAGGGGGAGDLGGFKETDVDPEIWEKFKAVVINVWTAIKNWAILKLIDIWFWFDNQFLRPLREQLIAFGETWKQNWEGFKTFAIQTVTAAWTAFVQLLGIIVGAGIIAYLWLKDVGTRLWEFLKEVWEMAKVGWDNLWNGVKAVFEVFWGWLVEVWNGFVEFITDVWNRAKESVVLIWQTLIAWIILKIIEIKQGWADFKEWMAEAWEFIKVKARETWDNIVEAWGRASAWFDENVIQPVTTFFSTLWAEIERLAGVAWTNISKAWEVASTWFDTNVIQPLTTAWDTFTNWISTKWEQIWGGLKDFVLNTINGIIGVFNGLLQGLVDGINGIIDIINSIKISFPDWMPFLGGKTFAMNLGHVGYVSIPPIAMATGGVIPPNSEFLAILGDQRSGRNIEAPEGLIREIIAEELSNFKGGSQEVTINFAGSLGALVRELKPYIDNENVRVGKSMIRGVA